MSSNRAILGAIISFFLPGIGLLLSKQSRMKGLLIFIIVAVADVVSVVIASILTLCIVGLLLFSVPFVIHIVAAIHTHDVIVKEDNSGKPILFE